MSQKPPPIPLFRRVYLLGTGLIGGSLALDLKNEGVADTVVGWDTDPARSAEAHSRGILDEVQPMEPEVLAQCDVVILAVPVLELEAILRTGFEAGTLVTDVGSVKGDTVKAYEESAAAGLRYRYVPGHPIAGDEKSGPGAARRGLFRGARVILTPVGETDEDVRTIQALWQGVGARTMIMDPDQHDAVFAWVSHMPHMAAFSIIDSVLEQDPDLVDLSGGGLRDYTRIAASSPRMWADIAVANRKEILAATRGLRASVDRILEALEEGDRDRLEAFFQRVARVRRAEP